MSRKRKLRKKDRGVWYQDANGLWRTTFGERKGNLISARQKRIGGPIIARVWSDGRYRSQSLKTADRDEAERLIREIQARLSVAAEPAAKGTATLGQLWHRFESDCRSWNQTKVRTQKDGAARAQILRAHFGDHFDMSRLCHDDLEGFVEARIRGHIELAGETLKAVSKRSAQADLHFLNRILNWAVNVRLANGTYWLTRNPAAKFSVRVNHTPQRPYSNAQRVAATLRAIEELLVEARNAAATRNSDDRAAQRREQRRLKRKQIAAPPSWCRWEQLRMAVILAVAYGRRLNSIRQLRNRDIDHRQMMITWRSDSDKKGKESVVPLLPDVAKALRAYAKHFPGVGDTWLFPALKNPAQPTDRHLFDAWLRKAEVKAELPKLKRGLWHPYRRRWAMDRKKMPISDVMEVGGWSDYETLLKCYQQPDNETMLEILEAPRRAAGS